MIQDEEEDKVTQSNQGKHSFSISSNCCSLINTTCIDTKAFCVQPKKDMLLRRMELLNSFKDHEILNAFKLSLINTDL